MELGYRDFQEMSPLERTLLPREDRGRKLYRAGAAGAGLFGALALIGVISQVSQAPPPAATVSLNTVGDAIDGTPPAGYIPNQVPTKHARSSASTWYTPNGNQAASAAAAAAGVPPAGYIPQQSASSSSVQSLVKAAADTRVFDEAGRFIMRAFDRFKPMSSFLPGVGGLWGFPTWAFYVNRGQGMATFGVENKDGGILLFQTAEKAYQITPYVGFRTFLKGKTAKGERFESQPFFPASDAQDKHTARRDMYIGNNEMEIEESDPDTGIRTNALYFTAPNEIFPALVRRVTLTNEGSAAVDLEVIDGLAKLEPTGTSTTTISAMGRTIEGWMQVFNFKQPSEVQDKTSPFFHLVTAPADTADVTLIKDGYFAVGFEEDEANVGADGGHALLPMICDQQLVFGTDTTLTVPRRFFSSAGSQEGAKLDELAAAPQSTTSRTPSAFAAGKMHLEPGQSRTLSIIYGHAPDLDTYVSTILPKLRAKGYVSNKYDEARAIGTLLTDRVAMSSGAPLFDSYAKQNFLDNVLRGGLPIEIGNLVPGDTPSEVKPKIFHTFSRIHGDLERDYNNFELEQSFWSQGPGNFRDVEQNRRCDVLQLPSLHDFNVRQFLSYVQADGYNPLTVATAFFKIHDAWRAKEVAQQLAAPGPTQDAVTKLISAPFRPGQLFNDLRKNGVELSVAREKFLDLVTIYAEQVPAGAYAQNGFWTDHFTYHLDLLKNFLAVFPDDQEAMLWDSPPVPFFLSPARVANRTEKNMKAAEPDTIRQYDAVITSDKKGKELQAIVGDPSYVGDTAAGGQWQRTADGQTFRVPIVAKLVTLCANKFAIMDPLGMGVEMEAGKPGWNDAMNGLPALFGSEMPAAYELHELIDFVGAAVDAAGRAVGLPEEVGRLLEALDTQLQRVGAGASSDFEYWDKAHDALEAYRAATEATFSGRLATWSPAKLGKARGVFGRMLARMDQGVERALSYAPKKFAGSDDAAPAVTPTYFRFSPSSFELAGVSGRGLPTVKVTGFHDAQALPLFLEGPVRYMKTLKGADHATKLAVYDAVAASPLHDTALSMYTVSESLAGQPLEVGRMMAFTSGWLENESVWLHMSYKWYLELLRAGLYEAFFAEIKKGVVCFMDTEVFGRSPLEATSFIVSSAFPEEALHGSGFLARLSGTTAEFLSMWNHMMTGPAPFSLGADGKLQLALAPIIPSWMWRDDGTVAFKFLGQVEVTYIMKAKKNSWEAKVTGYDLSGAPGKSHVAGETLPTAVALDVRNLQYSAITVTLE